MLRKKIKKTLVNKNMIKAFTLLALASLLMITFTACKATIKETKKQVKYDIVVAQDGSGNFTTLYDAIQSISQKNDKRVVIYVKNGTYKRKVNIDSGKDNISIIGESREGTIITSAYSQKTGSAKGCATLVVEGNGFTAENITFENSYGQGSQALAAFIAADKASFNNCAFKGRQDTLYMEDPDKAIGRVYFKGCVVEGDVDFIYGPATAVFNKCEIKSLDRNSDTNNGFITAANTPKTKKYGLVFLNCDLTSTAKEKTVALGRAYGLEGSSALFIKCNMGAHIKDDPWVDMKGKAADARFFEYKSTGKGAVVNEKRRQLSDEEAKAVTIENIIKGDDNWNPEAAVY